MKAKEKMPEIVETIEAESLDTFKFITSFNVNLDLAGILFVNAYLQIKEGQKVFGKLEKEITKYEAYYKKRSSKYSIRSDDFATLQLHKLRNIEVFYEPVVRHFSTAKILLVCCAETFVNEVATVILKGRGKEEFDKLSIIGKWILIQDLMNLKKKMTIDANPLQGFAQLVSERNKLVHFKGSKKSLESFQIPDYLNDLSLIPKSCLVNFKSVKELIRNFSENWQGSDGPLWLNAGDTDYRNPCFYMGSREASFYLYSDQYDGEL